MGVGLCVFIGVHDVYVATGVRRRVWEQHRPVDTCMAYIGLSTHTHHVDMLALVSYPNYDVHVFLDR